MRFIKLELSAIGSYVEPTTIDFTKLGKGCIYNIAGPTGVGKTTILDCLTLALYGCKNNGDSKDADIRSTQATPERESYVKLTFEVGDKLYRVERTPKYKALKLKRKNGKELVEKEVNASKVLYELDAEGHILAQYSKNDEFEKRLAEINSLNFNQFMMTGMMRQGGFVELLNADTNMRTEIFRQLFNTKVYNDIQEKLKENHKVAKDEYEQAKRSIAQELDKIICAGNPVLEGKYESYKALRYEGCVSETMKVLEELVAWYSQEQEQAQNNIDDNTKKLNQCTELLRKLQELQDLEAKVNQLQVLLAQQETELQKLQTAMVAAEAQYNQNYDDTVRQEQAQKQLLASFGEIEAQEKQLQEQEKKLQVQQNIAATNSNKVTGAVNKLQANNERLAVLGNVAEQMTSLIVQYKEVEGYHKELQTPYDNIGLCQQAKQNLEQSLLQLQQDLQAAQGQRAQVAKKVQQAEAAQASLMDMAKQEAAYKAQAGELEALAQALSAYFGDLLKAKDKAGENYTLQDQLKQTQDQRVKAILNQFLGNKAMEIARELQEGEICPVCGGLFHPAKAPQCQGKASATELAKARAELTRLEQATNKAFTALELAIQAYEDKATEIRNKGSLLFQTAADATIEEIAQLHSKAQRAYEQQYAEFRQGYDATQSLANTLPAAKKQYEAWENKEKEINANLLTTTNGLQHQDEQIAKSYAQLQNALVNPQLEQSQEAALLAQIDAYTSPISAGNAVAEVMEITPKILTLLEQKLKEITEAGKVKRQEQNEQAQLLEDCEAQQKLQASAQETLKQAELEIVKLQETISNKQQTITELQGKLQGSTKAKVLQTIAELGQRKQSLSDNKANTAEAYHELAKEVDSSKALQKATREQLDTLKLEKLPAKEEVLEEQAKALTAKAELQAAYDGILQKLHTNQGVNKAASKTHKKLVQLEQHHKLVEKLYRLASGNTNGSIKLPLETFVQTYYLDKVVDNARSLLAQMSDNRFELIRRVVTDTSTEGGKRKVGLDLNVIDKINNTERSVQTLSGGESFTAALALIISLSQVIQYFNSNNQNSALFIDEGFGSLDAKLLDLNIAALEKLSNNDLAIGIISHVAELEERIAKKLVVEKVNRGTYETSTISYEGV